MLDVLDLTSRVRKLEELKLGVRKEVQDMKLPNWSENIDDELKAGMIMAEQEVLKTLKLLGMLPALVKGNILKLEGDDIMNMNTHELGVFVVWDAPDENKVISSEELFDLDNDQDHSNNYCSTLTWQRRPLWRLTRMGQTRTMKKIVPHIVRSTKIRSAST